MPLPIIKVAITGMRLFSRPFVTVITRRIKHKPSVAEQVFFRWFGIRCYALEDKIERFTQKQVH